ncbi:MAG: PKD domain-containing protein [Flavobacterium piscis]|nr:PKD domain-containing protein [Flavobacterium piscis]
MKKITVYLIILLVVLTTNNVLVYSQPNTAVDFTVTDIDGNTHNLYSYLDAGKYVYVCFFLTTCGGCIGSVPDMNNIYQKFGCNEFELIILAVFGGNPTTDAVQQFRTDHGTQFPLVSPEGGSTPVVSYYEVTEYPKKIVIKPDRSVVWSTDYDLTNPYSVSELGPHLNACPDQWPIADFSGDPLVIPVNSGVTFTDLSQNPIHEWLWEFPGGNPSQFNGPNPPIVNYNQAGLYNVKLTVRNEYGNTNVKTRNNYVFVYNLADTLPIADFIADQIVVLAGNTVNFTDLSYDYPFEWQWSFESGVPATSTVQNPQQIRYNVAGEYDVKLIVRNSQGYDTILKENYIKVIPDVGPNPPIANFRTAFRLIQKNTKVYFDDLSTNNPMTWAWYFPGGEPNYVNTQLQPQGVIYANSGFYDVTLNVSNVNGSSSLTKHDYVVVYESIVGKICDTIQNVKQGEQPYAMQIYGMNGYYGGHNSDRINGYADFYEFHTFNKVYGVIVPIIKLSYGSNNSYIRFATWDGVDATPTTLLGTQKVFLKDLRENYYQVILFDEPLDIDGPFYLGYTINYAEGDNFVVGLVPNRGHGGQNTLWIRKDGIWKSSVQAYDIATSTGIRPITCLVGIEDEILENTYSVYPNPCNDKLYITSENYLKADDLIQLVDVSGKVVVNILPEDLTDKIELNTSEIKPGIYYLRIYTSGKLIHKKISVNR